MEKEPTYMPREEKFTSQIDDRLDLWTSIVDDSEVDQDTKEEIKKRLLNFQKNALTQWHNLEDAFYGTISSILTATSRDKNNEEAAALFENIRDDIWKLYDEIKS